MKSVIAGLLTLLALKALCAQVNGTVDHTYVNNLSSKKIKASVLYFFGGHGKFTDRIIDPGTNAADEYSHGNCLMSSFFGPPMGVTISVVPANCLTEVYIDCDHSLVIFDDASGHGVDVYVAQYGNINKPVFLLRILKCI